MRRLILPILFTFITLFSYSKASINRTNPSNDTTVCFGSTVYFEYKISNANQSDSLVFHYSDETGDFLNGTIKSLVSANGFSNVMLDTFTATKPGNYKFYVNIYNNNSLQDVTDSLIIKFNYFLVDIIPSSTTTICENQSTNFKFELCSISSIQDLKAEILQKSTNNLIGTYTPSSLNNPVLFNYLFTSPGTYYAKFYYKYKNTWYPIGNSEDVIVQALPSTPNFTLTQNQVCSPSRVTLKINNYSASNNYEVNDGSGWVSISSDSYTQLYDYVGGGFTTKNFQVRATKGPCTVNSINQSISINSRPEVSVSLNTFSSDPDWGEVIFKNRTTFRYCGVPPTNGAYLALDISNNGSSSINVDYGDGTASSNLSSPIPGSINHIYSNVGIDDITIIASTPYGCSETTYYYKFIGTNPQVTLSGPTTTKGECAPKTYTFRIDPASVLNNQEGTYYLVESNDGFPSQTFQHPPPATFTRSFVSSSCGKTTPSGYLNTYYVKITAINPCSSSPITLESIQLDQPSKVKIKTSKKIYCVNQTVNLIDLSTLGTKIIDNIIPTLIKCDTTTDKYWWVSPSGNEIPLASKISPIKSSTPPQFKFSQKGTYKIYTRQVLKSSSCGFNDDSVEVCIQDAVNANFSLNYKKPLCSPATFQTVNKSDTITGCSAIRYKWIIRDNSTNTVSNNVVFNLGSSDSTYNPNFTITAPGVYKITLVDTTECSVTSFDTVVTIIGPPTITFPIDKDYCGTQTLTMGSSTGHLYSINNNYGSSQIYNWTLSGGNGSSISVANSATPLITLPEKTDSCPKHYFIKLSYGNECYTTDKSQSIQIYPPIQNNTISSSQSLVCTNAAPTELTGSTPTKGNCSSYSYTWQSGSTIGTLTTLSGQTGINLNPPNQTGATYYQRTVTSGVCSSVSNNVLVNIIPPISGNSIGNNQSICQGNPVSSIGQSTSISISGGYNNTYTYSWEFSTDGVVFNLVSGANLSSYTPVGLGVGTFYYRRIVQSGGSGTVPCNSISNIIQIEIKPNPSFTITLNPSQVCPGQSSQVNLSQNTPIIPINSYQWSLLSGTNVSISNTTIANPILHVSSTNVSGITPNQIQLLAIASNGCSSTVSSILNVSPKPEAGFTLNKTLLCGGETVTITSTAQYSTSYIYTVSPSNGVTISNLNSPNPTITFPSNSSKTPKYYQILQTVGNPTCGDTISSFVVVKSRPNIVFAKDDSICGGLLNQEYLINGIGTFSYKIDSGAATGLFKYLWSYDTSLVISNSTLKNPKFNFPTVGICKKIYHVKLIFDNECGSDTANQNITIFPTIDSNIISGNDSVCAGDSIGLIAGTTPKGGDCGLYSYQWQRRINGVWTNFSGSTNSKDILLGTMLNSTDTIRRIVSSGKCISYSNSIYFVRLNRIEQNVQVIYLTKCFGDSGWIMADSVPINGGNGIYNYQWQISHDGINWTNITGANDAYYQPPLLTADTYFRRLVFSKKCVSFSSIIKQKVLPKPEILISINPDSVFCSGINPLASIKNFTTNVNINNYNWSIFSGHPGSLSSPNLSSTTVTLNPLTGTTTVNSILRLIVTSDKGCKDTADMQLTLFPKPTAGIYNAKNIICGPDTIHFINKSLYAPASSVSYSVSPSTNVNITTDPTTGNSIIQFPVNYGISQVQYTIKQLVGGACKDSAYSIINVKPKPQFAPFTLPTGVCPHDTLDFIASITAGSSIIQNINWTITPTPINFTFLGPRVGIRFGENQTNSSIPYTLTLTATTSDGCQEIIPTVIQLYNRPTALLKLTDSTSCVPGTIYLEDSSKNASLYQWIEFNNLVTFNPSNTNNNVAITTNTFVGNVDRNDLIFFESRTLNGCRDTVYKNIIWHPLPDIRLTPKNPSICDSNSVNFKTNTSTMQSPVVYKWEFNGNTIGANTNSLTRKFFNSSQQTRFDTMKVTATSVYGCINQDTTQVFVRPNAFVGIIPPLNYVGCAPFPIIIDPLKTISFPLANSGQEWWRIDSTPTVSKFLLDTTFNFPGFTIPNSNDTAYIQLIGKSKFGCKNADTIMTFRTIPNPTASFTSSVTRSCSPKIIRFNSTSDPGLIHSWDFGTNGTVVNTNANGTVVDVLFSNPTDAPIIIPVKLIVKVGSGTFQCKDSTITNITIDPKPSIDPISDAGICPFGGINIIPNAKSSSPPIQSTSFFINPTTDSINLTNGVKYLFGENQGIDSNYLVTIISQTLIGCADTSTVQINHYARPTAYFGIDDSTSCVPGFINITDSSQHRIQRIWSSNNSLDTIQSISPDSIVVQVRTNIFKGKFNREDSVFMVVKNQNQCADTISRKITWYPLPSIQINNGIEICDSNSLFFNASTSQYQNATSNYSLNWLKNSVSLYNGIKDKVTIPFYNPSLDTASQSVELIIKSDQGCEDSSFKSILVKPDAKAYFGSKKYVNCAPFIISIDTFFNYTTANSGYRWEKEDALGNWNLIGTGVSFAPETLSVANQTLKIRLIANSRWACKNDTITRIYQTKDNPKPFFVFVNDSSGCTPYTTQIQSLSTPSGVSHQWILPIGVNGNNNFGVTNTITGINKTFNDVIYDVKLIVGDPSSGCTDSITKSFTVFPLPRPDFNYSNNRYCYPDNGTVNFNSISPPQIDSIIWTNGSSYLTIIKNNWNDILSNQTSNIIFPDNITGSDRIDEIKLIAKSYQGCIDSSSKTYIVSTRPISNFEFNDTSKCGPDTATITYLSKYGTSKIGWSVDTGMVAISSNFSKNPIFSFPKNSTLSDQVYTITLHDTSSNGCIDSTKRIIKIHPQPQIKYTFNPKVGCGPLSVEFRDSSILKNQLKWYFTSKDSSASDIETFTFPTPFNRDTLIGFQLKVNSLFGCEEIVNDTVKVKPGPVAKFSASDTLFCLDKKLSVTNNFYNHSFGSIDTYTWYFGDNDSLITNRDTTVSHQYTKEGIYSVILKGENPCGISFDTLHVEVLENPKAKFTLSDTFVCGPVNLTITNQTTNIQVQYLWEVGNVDTVLPQIAKIIDTKAITSNILLYGDTLNGFDKKYYVRLIVKNRCNSDTLIDTITVRPKPTALFTPFPKTGCAPKFITLYNNSRGEPNVYDWEFSDTTSFNTNSNQIDPIRYYRYVTKPTKYWIKLRATNACGVDSMLDTVTITPNTIQAGMTVLSGQKYHCESGNVGFRNTSSGATTFFWNFGDNKTAITYLKATEDTIYHQYTKPGNYIISMRASNGCSDTTFYDTIFVFPKPTAKISTNRLNYCPGDPVYASGSASLNANTYEWNFGDGKGWYNSLGATPHYIYSTPGKYNITLVVGRQILDSNGIPIGIICYDSISQEINVNAIPKAIIASNSGYNDCSPFLATFTDQSTNSIPSQSLWDFGDNTTGIGSTVNHMYTGWGIFQVQLIAINAGGCRDTAYANVNVYEGPRVSFTVSKKDSCGPHKVIFKNTTQFSGPKNVLAYEWSIDSGQFGNFVTVATTQDLNYFFYGKNGSISPTKYIVRLKVNTNQPCVGYYYDTITIYPKAKSSVLFNIPDTSCTAFNILPSDIQITHYNDANGKYEWFVNNISISSPSSNPSFPGYSYNIPNSSFELKLVVYSLNGCESDSSTKTLFTYPNPISQFTIDIDSGCTPHQTYIRGRAVPSIVNYLWQLGKLGSFNTASIATSKPNINTIWNNPYDTIVVDTVWLIIHNPLTGCGDTSWKTIKLFPKPHSGIVLADSVCAGSSIIASFNGDSIPPSIKNYNWRWVSNPNNVGIINKPTDSSTLISFGKVNGRYLINHYVQLQVSTSNGCKDTIDKKIVLKPNPEIHISNKTSELCVPNSITFKNDSNQVGASYLWTTNTINGSIFNPNSSDSLHLFYFDRQNSSSETFNYQVVMVDSRSCSDTEYIQLIAHPRPLNDYIPQIDTLCPDTIKFSNLTIGEKPIGYQWKINNWTSNLNEPSYFFANNTLNPIVYLDTLFSTSNFGCKDTLSSHKYIYPKPKASFTTSFITPNCAPIHLNNAHFNVNPLLSTNQNFQWLIDGSPITAVQAGTNFPGYDFSIPDSSFIVSLVAFSKYGCGTDTQSILFRTYPNPIASFNIDSIQGCSPLKVSATSNSTPTSTPLNLIWTLGSNNGSYLFPSSSTSSPSIRTIWLNNGTSNSQEIIKLKVTNPITGCSDSTTRTLVTYPKPQANITGNDSVCASDQLTLNYVQNPSRAFAGGIQWSWILNSPIANISNPNATSTSISFPDLQGISTTHYQLIQVVTTNNGCTDTAYKDLWMKQRPKIFIATHLDSLCVPAQVTLNNLGTQTGASYQWKSNLGTYLVNILSPKSPITNISLLDRKGNRDTTYTFELLMIDARGCRDTDYTNITIHPRPLARFTPINDQVCANTTTTFNNTTVGQEPVSYLWKINQWTSNIQNPTYTFSNPNFRDSTYFDTLIATSTYGCKDTLSGTRVVWYNPKARISRIGINQCEPFYFIPTDSSKGHQSFRNRWILTNNGVTIKDTTGSNPNFKALLQSSTPYELTLITTNQYLCLSDTDKISFFVRPKPKAFYSVDTNRICTGSGLIRFTNQSQIFSGQVNYQWNFGDSTQYDTSYSPSHFYNSPKAYWTSLLVTSDFGCVDSFSKVIYVGKRAKAEFTSDLTKGCDTVRVQFNNLSLFSDSAQWDFGNGLQSGTYSPATYFTTKPGTYTITLRAIGLFGCDDTISKNAYIQVYQKPIAAFDVDSIEKWLPFRTFRFTNRSKGDPYSSHWFFGDGNESFVRNATHAYRDTGWYAVKLVVTGDTTGCVDSISKMIRLNWVDCYLKVPNAFQPEGPNGVNLFNAVGSGFESYKLEIYSSWGELLYRTTELNPDGSIPMNIGWDGKHHFKPGEDKILSLDTYVYKIEAKCLNGKDWKEKAGSSPLEKRVGTFQMIR
jgi:PKD repeat protein